MLKRMNLLKGITLAGLLLVSMMIMGCSAGEAPMDTNRNATEEMISMNTQNPDELAWLHGDVKDAEGSQLPESFVILYENPDNAFPAYLTMTNETGYYGDMWFYFEDENTYESVQGITPGHYALVAFNPHSNKFFAAKIDMEEGTHRLDITTFQRKDSPDITESNSGRMITEIMENLKNTDSINNLRTLPCQDRGMIYGKITFSDGTPAPRSFVKLYADHPNMFPAYASPAAVSEHYGEQWFYAESEDNIYPVDGIEPGYYMLIAVNPETGCWFIDECIIEKGVRKLDITLNKTEWQNKQPFSLDNLGRYIIVVMESAQNDGLSRSVIEEILGIR